MMKKIVDFFIKNAPVLVFLLIWEVAARVSDTPLLPPFSLVMAEFLELLRSGFLLENLGYSFFRVVIGYLVGGVFGIVVGIVMGVSKKAEKMLAPLISLLLPIPTLGWLPLLMLWIGINEALPITLIFICAFFPVAYATLLGIKEVPKEYINSAKVLGASNTYILFRVILPLASPSIFTGLRLEAGMVWKTVLASEMFAIPTGIGAMMINAESLIRVDVIMIALTTLSLMSFGFEKSIYFLEKITTGKWR